MEVLLSWLNRVTIHCGLDPSYLVPNAIHIAIHLRFLMPCSIGISPTGIAQGIETA